MIKTTQYRTHTAQKIDHTLVAQSVRLAGWVSRRRDHGGVIFIDLRDDQGYCQLVFDPSDEALFQQAESCRQEYVISIQGIVRQRPEGTINESIPSGTVEILVESMEILNRCLPLPFSVADAEHISVGEETRLRYRYLDMRRDEAAVLKSRASVLRTIRHYLDELAFIEVETPVLTKPTPEGAREYLVPSRLQPGHAYALVQSPQQYKQLLMVGGVSRYYQVVKCFRDEDLRADRQPEFTQVDLELAFVDQAGVMSVVEGLFRAAIAACDVVLDKAIPVLTFAEVMRDYGSDKPDLRNPLKFTPLDDLVFDCGFSVFEVAAKTQGQRVVGLRLPAGCDLSRKQLDDLTALVAKHGAKGLAYIKLERWEGDTIEAKSPIIKFFNEGFLPQLLQTCGCKVGDILFFGSGPEAVVNQSMSVLRDRLARDRDLIATGFAPLWVVDFPMFEQDQDSGQWHARHHPFTQPQNSDHAQLSADPESCLAYAYDLVLNGYEIGGGSMRIHDPEQQKAVLSVLGMADEQSQSVLAHMVKALSFGAPPHGGFALGLDRLMMILLGKDSIRDVIAFPKTQNGSCPLTNGPSRMDDGSLEALSLLKLEVATDGVDG